MKKLNVYKAMKGTSAHICVGLIAIVLVVVLLLAAVINGGLSIATYNAQCTAAGGVSVKKYDHGYVCIAATTIELEE